jgi:hypothetical protein
MAQEQSEHAPFKFTVSQAVWLVFGVIEILIAVRVGLLLFGADPNYLVVALVYNLSHFILYPFAGITSIPTAGSMFFETSSMFAMIIYVLLGGVLVNMFTKSN